MLYRWSTQILQIIWAKVWSQLVSHFEVGSVTSWLAPGVYGWNLIRCHIVSIWDNSGQATQPYQPHHVEYWNEVGPLPCTKLHLNSIPRLCPCLLFCSAFLWICFSSLQFASTAQGFSLAMIETLGLISSHAHGTIRKRHQLMNKQQQQIDGRRRTERREKITQARGWGA